MRDLTGPIILTKTQKLAPSAIERIKAKNQSDALNVTKNRKSRFCHGIFAEELIHTWRR